MYATGKNTFFGSAASLIAGTNAVANIQKVCLLTALSPVCCIVAFVRMLVMNYQAWMPACAAAVALVLIDACCRLCSQVFVTTFLSAPLPCAAECGRLAGHVCLHVTFYIYFGEST